MTTVILELPKTDAESVEEERQKLEWLTCSESPLYFIHHYCQIYDAVVGDWIPFHLWPAQARTLKLIQTCLLIILLKARQIGMTWLALGFALWLMLFHPAATVLLFSKRDDEAVDLLDFRLKGMYRRLPDWMQARAVEMDNAHEWVLSNDSRAKAFPTTGGDSYTATLVIGDEFDLVPNQDQMIRAVKPTIDNGGRMILLSRPDKSHPNTQFKRIYQAACQRLNEWRAIFLPWYAHIGRDQAWYEAQRVDILARTGSEDDLWEQYPETDTQALAARTLDKRIPPQWLEQCYQPVEPLILVGQTALENPPRGLPAIPGLEIYRLPVPDEEYVMGADPAEGLPASDDSSLTVIHKATGEQVAKLSGKYEPKLVFPKAIRGIGLFYNHAPVLVERNNHGHAVIGWLQANPGITVLYGHDKRPGWLTTEAGNVQLYDTCAAAFMERAVVVHSRRTHDQIGSIDRDKLESPEGLMDDEADSFALAVVAQSAPQQSWESD